MSESDDVIPSGIISIQFHSTRPMILKSHISVTETIPLSNLPYKPPNYFVKALWIIIVYSLIHFDMYDMFLVIHGMSKK